LEFYLSHHQWNREIAFPSSCLVQVCTVVQILASKPVGTIFNFVREDGVSVLTFEVTQEYLDMTITTPALQGDKWYNIFIDGTVSGGTNFHGLYTGATYTDGYDWKTFHIIQNKGL